MWRVCGVNKFLPIFTPSFCFRICPFRHKKPLFVGVLDCVPAYPYMRRILCHTPLKYNCKNPQTLVRQALQRCLRGIFYHPKNDHLCGVCVAQLKSKRIGKHRWILWRCFFVALLLCAYCAHCGHYAQEIPPKVWLFCELFFSIPGDRI